MSNKIKETDEDKIKRYKEEEQVELDNISDLADQYATATNAYGGSLNVDEEFKDRFKDAEDKKIEKNTERKINKALRK